MTGMNTIEMYYAVCATEKARLRNVTVNGKRATVVFKEYEAPEEMKEEFKKLDNSDGHYFYITFYIYNGARSYYTNKEISTDHTFITTKEEGNNIYRQLKANKEINMREI